MNEFHPLPPSNGFYVDLAKTPDGNLSIRLNQNGRTQFDVVEHIRDEHGIDEALRAMLEDHLANGWEMVPPEDIGALTAAPILSDEIQRDDRGEIVEVGRVYWYPEYQIRDEIEELRTNLEVLFRGAS